VALATVEVNDELKHDYRPIRDYALIGDCHGAALVSRDGSIDWCCLGRFDADPVFCRLLDARIAGYFSIRPIEAFSVTRAYLRATNVLETRFTTDSGTVVITDFMPIGRRLGSGTHNYVDLVAPNWVVRIVEVSQGAVELSVHYRPTILFGRKRAKLRVGTNCISVESGPFLYHDIAGFSVTADHAEARVKVDCGQQLFFVVAAKPIDGADPLARISKRIEGYKEVTIAFWREWIAYCRYKGPFQEAVRRSLLAIKLLIYAPTGAIVAAPTTSLPEHIGGVRNWDYRYCWLRDAAFALYALGTLAAKRDASAHFSRRFARKPVPI